MRQEKKKTSLKGEASVSLDVFVVGQNTRQIIQMTFSTQDKAQQQPLPTRAV